MKSYKLQNKVRGPITWTDYCDILEKIELNLKTIYESSKSFKYRNQYLILKVNFDTEIGDYFEISIGLISYFRRKNFDLEINEILKKLGLRKWDSDIYYKLCNTFTAKKIFRAWKVIKIFSRLLNLRTLFFKKDTNYTLTIEEVLKYKNNDYTFLENDFNTKYNTNLISYYPLDDKFKFSRKVSVIIPSYNSVDTLFSTLETLNNQLLSDAEFKLLEVIVIDDGSTDDTGSKIKGQIYKFLLKYFKQNNIGRSAARNMGVVLASGETLIFLDSDVFLEKNLIREHAFRSESMNSCVFVSFRENVYLDVEEVLGIISNNVKPNIKKDFRFEKEVSPAWKRVHKLNQSIETRIVRLVEETNNFKNFGNGKVLGVWDIPSVALSCSISMRKSEFLKVGGFALKFKGWGMEDTFFGACMIANGNFIVPIFSTGIYHIKHPERSGSPELQLNEFNRNVEVYNQLIQRKLNVIIKNINILVLGVCVSNIKEHIIDNLNAKRIFKFKK